jgi:hypothetical protein
LENLAGILVLDSFVPLYNRANEPYEKMFQARKPTKVKSERELTNPQAPMASSVTASLLWRGADESTSTYDEFGHGLTSLEGS